MYIVTILTVFAVAIFANGEQIIVADGATFSQNWKSSIPFETAKSPEEIGLPVAGSNIWYLKSYLPSDENQNFALSFQIPEWICRGTRVQISIRYFSNLAPTTVWPVFVEEQTGQDIHWHGGSNYVNLENAPEGWNNFVATVDITSSEQILIDGVILPMGHFVFDEIILLYTNGDCYHHNGTTTAAPRTETTTPSPTESTTTRPPITSTTTASPTSHLLSTTPTHIWTTPTQSSTAERYSTDPHTSTTTLATTAATHSPITDDYYIPDPTAGPKYNCPPFPDMTGDPIPPSDGLRNFIMWKLLCFSDWAYESERIREPTIIENFPEFDMRGEAYDMKTSLSNIKVKGMRHFFSTPLEENNFQANLNEGYVDIRTYNGYISNPPTFTVDGHYQSEGSVLSFMLFSAEGEVSTTFSLDLQFHFLFHIANGHIVVQWNENFYQQFHLYVTRWWEQNISNFEDSGIPPSLMDEIRSHASNQIMRRLTESRTPDRPGTFDIFRNAFFDYLDKIFAETSVLDIIRTPYPPPRFGIQTTPQYEELTESYPDPTISYPVG